MLNLTLTCPYIGTRRKFCKLWEFFDQNNAYKWVLMEDYLGAGSTPVPLSKIPYFIKWKRAPTRVTFLQLLVGLEGSAYSYGLSTVKWVRHHLCISPLLSMRLYLWRNASRGNWKLTFIFSEFIYSYVLNKVTIRVPIW